MLNQINKNSYFGYFEILSFFFWDINFIFHYCLGSIIFFFIIVLGVLFSFHYCFGSIIFFPIIVLEYYFILFYTHIMSRVKIDALEFVLGTFNLSIKIKAFALFCSLD